MHKPVSPKFQRGFNDLLEGIFVAINPVWVWLLVCWASRPPTPHQGGGKPQILGTKVRGYLTPQMGGWMGKILTNKWQNGEKGREGGWRAHCMHMDDGPTGPQ